jgi:predicted RNase H-like nuclease (RuvC/YqgF family)
MVESYNAKIKEYETQAAALNQPIKKRNDALADYKTAFERFTKQCKDKAYAEEDYEAVVKKLGYGFSK